MKSISYICSRIYAKISRRIKNSSLMYKLHLLESTRYPIIKNPCSLYDIVYHIKDATWESMTMPEVWQMGKRYDYSMYHNAQNILRVNDAIVTPKSDVVLTKEGAIWDKYDSPMFNYMYAFDSNLTKYDKEYVYIRRPKTIKHISGDCLSLLGVFEDVWAHFIVQFLPKLYYAQEAGLLTKEVTVIVPPYSDPNNKELVDNILTKYPTIKPFVIQTDKNNRCVYKCDTLYWIPTASALSNDTKIPILYQNIIPQRVLDIFKKDVFSAYKNDVCSPTYEKIFLVRKGKYRNLTNIDEIEEYFAKKGFQFIEPHKLTLKQKICIFRSAKIIAGPQSGAWTNIIFCNKAKGLMLTPISWLYDGYLGYISKGCCHVLMVPGEEIYYKSSHNPYHIPIEKIQEAYVYLVNQIED